LQTSPSVGPSADGELLTQGSVLQRQRGLRHKCGPGESEQG
jgi:ribosomal protein L27